MGHGHVQDMYELHKDPDICSKKSWKWLSCAEMSLNKCWYLFVSSATLNSIKTA